ncbi:MAG TPA: MBL fold metallo-hydrolase, partial [Bacillales bacterium]|nr:MBL fold metallo-hydrolase [Bacillales bacterium]
MKIKILGTAAGDQIPSPYCNCSTCAHARKHRGRNHRKRCSYFINDNLLVDMGPDLLAACAIHDVDLMNVKYALVTHSHRDHFFVQNLTNRAARAAELPPLTFVAPPSVMTLLSRSGASDTSIGLKRRPILPYDNVDLEPYQIGTVKATHIPGIGDAVNYIIDDGRKKVLIASDTAVYKDEVWPHLENLRLDQLIIECTMGTDPGKNKPDTEKVHLNIEGVKKMLAKMRAIGAV